MYELFSISHSSWVIGEASSSTIKTVFILQPPVQTHLNNLTIKNTKEEKK